MNHYGVSYEVAYRHEQLQRATMRRHPTDSTRHQRRWWFARRRTTMPEPSAPPAPLTLTVPAVGTAEFNDLAAEAG
jgi:hypothetical protein